MAPMTIVICLRPWLVLFSSMHFIALKTVVKLKQIGSLWVWRVVCGTPYVSSIQNGQLTFFKEFFPWSKDFCLCFPLVISWGLSRVHLCYPVLLYPTQWQHFLRSLSSHWEERWLLRCGNQCCNQSGNLRSCKEWLRRYTIVVLSLYHQYLYWPIVWWSNGPIKC